MIKVKGNIMYHFRDALISKVGEEKYHEIIDNLDSHAKDVYNKPIISGEWYDLEYFNQFLKAMLEGCGKDLFEQICEEVGGKQMTGIFGIFLKLVSWRQILDKCPKFWLRLYSHGIVEFQKIEEDEIIFTISDFKFTEAFLMGFTSYLKRWFDLIFKKKVTKSYRRLEGDIVEFTYKIG